MLTIVVVACVLVQAAIAMKTWRSKQALWLLVYVYIFLIFYIILDGGPNLRPPVWILFPSRWRKRSARVYLFYLPLYTDLSLRKRTRKTLSAVPAGAPVYIY
jgi:hypothetical protein